MLKTIAAAALGLALLSPPVAAQDPAAGARVFNKCRACHQVGPTAKNGVGPTLNGLFGRKGGAIEGFRYSDGYKDVTWTEEFFATYIADPKAAIKGSRMAFAGLKNEQEVKDIIAFLKQYKADGSTN